MISILTESNELTEGKKITVEHLKQNKFFKTFFYFFSDQQIQPEI